MAEIARTDEDIQADVLEEFRWDSRIRASDIGVQVRDGVVTLTGSVSVYPKKWAAADAAHKVRGVTAVANEIEVRLLPHWERTDADIAEAVRRTLEWKASVPDNLEVTVSNGSVTLGGEVEWQYQKAEVEREVQAITGVTGVSNQINVKPTAKPSPTEMKRDIEAALVRSAEMDAGRITVEVDGGRVILRGAVRSYAEKRGAELVAWSAPGVSSVDNQIKISY